MSYVNGVNGFVRAYASAIQWRGGAPMLRSDGNGGLDAIGANGQGLIFSVDPGLLATLKHLGILEWCEEDETHYPHWYVDVGIRPVILVGGKEWIGP